MANNATSTIYGTDLIVMIETATDSWQQLAHATSHSVTLTRDTREVSSKSTGEWMLSDYAKISWAGSADALATFDSGVQGYNELVALMIARTKIKIISVQNDATIETPLDDTKLDYDPTSGSLAHNTFVEATTYYEGEAVITDISLTAAEGETATFSMSFAGASALVPKTVVAAS